jgi:arabinofuranan 3-O-arabinosyltransferase
LAIVALMMLQLPAIWNGSLVDRQLRRPEQIPTAWSEAATALQQHSSDTRVLELPGQEFSAFRWGTTTDQLLPGLMTRPTLTRDLLPLGSPEMMDLLLALDNRLQDGTLRSDSIAPVARLLGVGDVVVRGDERFEKYQTPRPDRVAQLVATQPPGLGAPTSYGPPAGNPGPADVLDAVALADTTFPHPLPAATVFPVGSSVPILRAEATRGSVLMAGSGDGVVDAADLLPSGALVRYSAEAVSDQQRREWAADAGLIVLTDSNRKRAQQWRGSQNTVGMTEDQSPGVLTVDTADVRLPLFPTANADSQTLALQQSGTVHATAYGEPNAYRPEDRAVMAFDGDASTFWRVADRADAVGQRIEASFDAPRPAESFVVRQPPGDRTITQLTVSADNGTSSLTLDPRSQSAAGQPLGLPAGMISKLTLEITATTGAGSFLGQNAVGIDVVSDGPPITEVVRPPIDISRSVGIGLADRPLAIVLSRERADPASTYRSDPEPRLQRVLQIPADIPFTLSGNAHIADRSPDVLRTASLSSSGHLEGSEQSRVSSAFDGNSSTRWVAPMGQADGEWLGADLGTARTIDHLDISQPDGDRFSPVDHVDVTLGDTTRSAPVDANGRVSFESMTGRRLRVTFHSANPRSAIDPHFNEPVALPVAITDVAVPGWSAPVSTGLLPTTCRDDLLTIDSKPLAIQVAADGVISPCTAGPIMLTAGEHHIASSPGTATGIDLDRLVLRHGAAVASLPTPAPAVHRTTRSSAETVVQIEKATDPFLLVFGQGWASGWRASLDGHDIGTPVKVDGGSMAWPIDPATTPATVTISWRPQRFVNGGLLVSAVGAAACLLLAVFGRRRVDLVPSAPRLKTSTRDGTFVGVLTVAVFAAAVVAPWSALAVGAIAIISRTVRVLRRLGLVAAVVCVGITGVFVAGQQFRHRYRPGFGWPQSFASVHQLALLALLFLVADATSAPQKPRSPD